MDPVNSPQEIRLKRRHREAMRRWVEEAAPEEGCGLVAGIDGESKRVVLIENILHSPVRYEMKPEQVLQAFLSLEEEELDLLAIFHSHPSGPPFPSRTDIAEGYYPEAAQIIWYPTSTGWKCSAFVIHAGTFSEISIHEVDD